MKKLLMIVFIIFVLASGFIFDASAAPIGQNQNYKVTLKISNPNNSGTVNENLNFTFYGTKGKVTTGNVKKRVGGVNPLTKGKVKSFSFSHADLGIIYAVEVSCGWDAVQLDYVRIESQYDGDKNMYNQIAINSWIKDGSKLFLANKGSIFKISFLNGDGLFAGTSDNVSIRLMAPNNDTTRDIPVNMYLPDNVLHRGQTDSIIVFSYEALSSVNRVYVKRNSTLAQNSDDWQPVAVTVQQLSGVESEGKGIKFSSAKLFLCNQSVPNNQEVALTYHSQGNLNIASIFYEPNFWVILSITVLLAGLGVVFIVVKKKGSKKDLKQANTKRKEAVNV